MGDQSGSPTSEPNREERWTIYVCPQHGGLSRSSVGSGIHPDRWACDRCHAPVETITVVPESLLTVERERRQRAEEERDEARAQVACLQQTLGEVIDDRDNAERRTKAVQEERDAEYGARTRERARAQRLAEALEGIAGRESVTMKGEGQDRVGVLRSYREAAEIARRALASVPDRSTSKENNDDL